MSKIDFKKLDRNSLERILKHYKVSYRVDQKATTLATLATRAFDNAPIPNELTVFEKFVSQISPTQDTIPEPVPEVVPTKKRRRDQLDSEHARIGEQVAANVSRIEENGGWILANILEYNSTTCTYVAQDEDDASRVMTLPLSDVKRLEDSAAHIQKGDKVISVFPDTTSFYRAVVVKSPKNPTHGNGAWEVIVRFQDDEDDSGNTPARRVPARFVLKRSDIEEISEEES
mmetsp:Transcript_8182/g.8346  ORF Transcript_8182/g.8346 Transcript_8182/m.8346 type:complete len:230 (-) Transcript_8182:211-900(-)